MPFKKISKPPQVASSPEKLLLDLPRRRIPGVLAHQAEVMRSYARTAQDQPDVALQLPTGSGKTLVGALIAEWIRRKRGARVVYLAPTVQLVNQVVAQCEEKYGIQAVAFHGPASQFSAAQRAEYRTAEKIAVSTYSHVFNSNPFFGDADTLILDDAHASENYVSKNWSVGIDRSDATHARTFDLLTSVIGRVSDATTRYKLTLSKDTNSGWVEKLPTPALLDAGPEIMEILDEHAPSMKSVKYSWPLLRDHLQACQLYFNESEIQIRPLIPPTWTHDAFTLPRQRIYMSATLGGGGDLERQFGRREICRIPVPADWDKQGVGRRLFLFPGMSLDDPQLEALRLTLMKKAGRSLVLVPGNALANRIESSVSEKLRFPVFSASDIEASLEPFTSTANAVAIVANRYDGIDFPGDSCRLLFVEGLPRATNLQERFLMTRMGANLLFNERVQTRVLQAIGRCTRSLEDYSAVVVTGSDLQDYLTDARRRKYLHPEIQAEIQFGVEQSKDVKARDFEDILKLFLENGEDWEAANQDIIQLRESVSRADFPSMEQLAASVSHEIAFQVALWQGDYINAMDCAGRVLGTITDSDLKGYRALWNYLAGSAAALAFQNGMLQNNDRAKEYFFAAKNAAIGLPWWENAWLQRFQDRAGWLA